MDARNMDYLVRDQDDGPVTLDLLQAWGPPLRPPLRVRLATAWRALLTRLRTSLPRPEPRATDHRDAAGLPAAMRCGPGDVIGRCCMGR